MDMDTSLEDGAIPRPESIAVRQQRWARRRDLAGLLVAWGVWAAMTLVLLLYIRNYSRNLPFWDDFELVPVMTGVQPVNLSWAWAQHNEHRPMISRLIIAGLVRFVANDFRAPRYANVVLLSAMAAAMLMLVRRLRGSARIIDAALPLAILNVAQSESLLIGFAMNLILTSLLAVAAIIVVGQSRRWNSAATALAFGAILVLLPLSGGSGLAMLPPLAAWLAGYVAWGWWSGRSPGVATRATGLVLLAASVAVAAFYLWGYHKPPYHPFPRSAWSVATAMLMYLSLAICPHLSSYWWPVSLMVSVILMATFALLSTVAIRKPEERPRALGLMAIIASMLAVAAAVGIGRSGFGPSAILVSRYITLAAPLLCALYVAWLVYGGPRSRAGILSLLLVMAGVALPDCYRYGKSYGWNARISQQRVERSLTDRVPQTPMKDEAILLIFPDAALARGYFRMLKQARLGAFVHYDDDVSRASLSHSAPATIRR